MDLAVALMSATLTVGPGKTYATPCAAIAAAQPGDTVAVDAGSYNGDTCAWSTDGLTIMGVGGRARIDLAGVQPAQQKGIFTISAPNATIENFELSGAAISAGAGNNGAGIRHQGTNLTVRNCFLHDNQDGILGAPPVDGTGSVLIEYSELANNGAGDGYSHNMYLNHYGSFTLRYSYSHGAKVGHLVKTRAWSNTIAYNRITDETGTTASYEIDIPNGGASVVIGNLIEQSAASQNPTIVTTGEEGTTNPAQTFVFVNNTIVNDLGSGTFVNVAVGTTATLENNVFHGMGTLPSGGTTNWNDSMGDPMLANQASYDYHLVAGSPCIDKGTLPAAPPDHEYVHPANTEVRAIVGANIDIGAYEFGNVATSGDGGSDGGAGGGDGGGSGGDGGRDGSADGGSGGSGTGGCGCVVGAPATTTCVWPLAVILPMVWRRRRQPRRPCLG